MTKRRVAGAALCVALVLGVSGCTNPYDPGQRAVGGGLLGAGTGAALGAIAGGGHGAALGAAIGGAAGVLGGVATTPRAYYPPPGYPPPGYYPPPPGYYGAPAPSAYGAPAPGAAVPPPPYGGGVMAVRPVGGMIVASCRRAVTEMPEGAIIG